MSSIITNTGAMFALQTLKSINNNLADTQAQISTGKKINNAADNAAVWAIAKTMESDVNGFEKISEGLAVAQSSVSVARDASESITDLLTQMKEKIVQATNAANDDERTKINADVTALRDQVTSVVEAAQFSGVNLINGTSGQVKALSSLNRDASGVVTAKSITVGANDLSVGAYAAKAALTGSTGASTAADAAAFTMDNGGGTGSIIIVDPTYAAGDSLSVRIGDQEVKYTFTADDIAAGNNPEDVAAGALKAKIDGLNISGLEVDFDPGTNAGQLSMTNTSGVDLSVSVQFSNVGAGALGAISGFNVSTAGGATTALGSIDSMIKVATDAGAAFGTAQNRLETQSDFVSQLTDNLKTSIGSMVDADMEAASARLQALQVQQQLGTQSLSIANQGPQNLLSLFR